jgi:hypothetical protein
MTGGVSVNARLLEFADEEVEVAVFETEPSPSVTVKRQPVISG